MHWCLLKRNRVAIVCKVCVKLARNCVYSLHTAAGVTCRYCAPYIPYTEGGVSRAFGASFGSEYPGCMLVVMI